MSNILKAFVNITNNYRHHVKTVKSGNNRANNMGEDLEHYIQSAFANIFSDANIEHKLRKFQEIFSYQGNKNNPPDLMLKNGDAIEIKKLESKNSAIAQC